MRDSPRRALLDDLDRAEEEIDSILATIQQQMYVISELGKKDQFYTWPGIKSWGDSLDRTRDYLRDKEDIYRDLKGRIELMRRQASKLLPPPKSYPPLNARWIPRLYSSLIDLATEFVWTRSRFTFRL